MGWMSPRRRRNGRCLARPVWSQIADDLACGNLKIKTLLCADRAKAFPVSLSSESLGPTIYLLADLSMSDQGRKSRSWSPHMNWPFFKWG